MDSYDIGRFAYLALLLTAIAGYYLVAHRDNLGQVFRHAALWGLIFVGVLGGYGLWSDIRRDVAPRQSVVGETGRIEVPRGGDGHYHLRLVADGVPVDFVVDTGATDIVLSRRDAARVGIDLNRLVFTGIAGTANGIVRTARTTVDLLELGPIADHNVAVWVNEGEMDGSLLGMAYLQRFGRIEISGDTLVLER